MTDRCGCEGNGVITCPACGGAGGFHDCGEDSCCCLDPDTSICETCNGDGEVSCPCTRRTDEAT